MTGLFLNFERKGLFLYVSLQLLQTKALIYEDFYSCNTPGTLLWLICFYSQINLDVLIILMINVDD